MRNLKKVLSLVLAMAMMLSVMVVGAGASYDTFKDQDKIVNEEAVFLLHALDIVEGRDTGDFDPTDSINRAEAAKLVAALNLAGVPVPNAKGVSSFTDVLGDGSTAWANNYIEYCVSQGSVNGVGDNRFAPKADVTGVQFAKMLLGILGYKTDVEGYTGTNWQYNVNIDAVDAGLYRGLDIDATAALSRDDAAQMMYNALKAKTVIYLTDTTGALKLTNKNLMETIYPTVYGGEGVMTYIEYNVDKEEYTYTIGGEKFKTDVDYTDMLHMNVMYVIDRIEGVLGFYAYDNGAVDTGLWGDFDTDSDLYDADETSVVVLQTGHEGHNVNSTVFVDAKQHDLHDFDEYKAIDNDNDGTYDMVLISEVNFETVSYVDQDYIMYKGLSNKFDTECVTIPADLAKGDYVTSSWDTSLKTWFVVEKLTAQAGTINTVRGDNGTVTEIVIGGKTYDYCADKCLVIDAGFAGPYHNWPGMNVEFYVINGYVVYMDENNSLTRDYLLITAIDGDYNADGYSVDATVLFGDNTTKVITIDSLDGQKGENIRSAVLPYMEQTVGANGQIGYLARYELLDNGKYELTSTYELDQMVANDQADLGFDATAARYNTTAPVYHPATNNAEFGYITVGNDVVRIAEDALVFLVDESGSEYVYSAVSGADIANMTSLETTVNYVGYEEGADGFDYATLIYIQTDLEYMSADITGIIVSEPKFEANEDDDFVYFDLFDGEKTYTVYADLHSQYEPVLSNLEVGHVIDYRVDDGMLQMVRFVEGVEAAITAYAPDTNYADLKLLVNGTEVAADLADDVKVFFMNTEDYVIVNGQIEKAGQDQNDNFINNVFVVADSQTGEIVLMVVDPVKDADGIKMLFENLLSFGK